MAERVVVFFLHQYAEVDHIVPIIYKWLEERNIRTEVVLTGLDNIQGDYRIELLREYEQANVHFAADLVGKDPSVHIYAPPNSEKPTNYMDWRRRVNEGAPLLNAVKEVGRRLPTDVPERVWRRYRSRPTHPLQWLADRADDIFDAVVGDADEAVVTFDWANAHPQGKKPRITFTHKIVKRCHENGFVTVAWPHGDTSIKTALSNRSAIDAFSNNVRDPCALTNLYESRWRDLEYERRSRNVHDYWVSPNHALYPYFDSVIDDKRLVVLGSARYNVEWVGLLSDIAPEFAVETLSGPKVVLLLQSPNNLMMRESFEVLIRFLSAFPDINLVLKAHTRLRPEEMDLVGPDGQLTKQQGSNIHVVYNDVHTTSLIQWADAIVDMGTGASIESVVRKVPLFHLDFIHGNDPVYTADLPSVNMRSFDDLHEQLCRLYREEVPLNYDNRQRDAFVRNTINHPDAPEGEVLLHYVKFIQSLFDSQSSRS